MLVINYKCLGLFFGLPWSLAQSFLITNLVHFLKRVRAIDFLYYIVLLKNLQKIPRLWEKLVIRHQVQQPWHLYTYASRQDGNSSVGKVLPDQIILLPPSMVKENRNALKYELSTQCLQEQTQHRAANDIIRVGSCSLTTDWKKARFPIMFGQ